MVCLLIDLIFLPRAADTNAAVTIGSSCGSLVLSDGEERYELTTFRVNPCVG